MNKIELRKILENHKLWLCGEGGEEADLRDADLRDADLYGANLRGADLYGADLYGADLRDANLNKADLRDADLRDANLNNADLYGADLRDAILYSANLSNANLSNADLRYIKTNISTTMYHSQCPEEGSYIAWKKCKNNIIVKLLIPEDALRSSATSRKCRASKAIVLDVIGADFAVSNFDDTFIYEVGKTVSVENFDTDRWNECSTGIHHFITRAEAESY